MFKIVLGIFIILHGLVHFLYLGQSRKWFELQPGLTWPAGSWAFSRVAGEHIGGWLASICCALCGIGLIGGGLLMLAGLDGWHIVVMGLAAFSALMFALFWNGKRERLDQQGWVGVLLDLALMGIVSLIQSGTIVL